MCFSFKLYQTTILYCNLNLGCQLVTFYTIISSFNQFTKRSEKCWPNKREGFSSSKLCLIFAVNIMNRRKPCLLYQCKFAKGCITCAQVSVLVLSTIRPCCREEMLI